MSGRVGKTLKETSLDLFSYSSDEKASLMKYFYPIGGGVWFKSFGPKIWRPVPNWERGFVTTILGMHYKIKLREMKRNPSDGFVLRCYFI